METVSVDVFGDIDSAITELKQYEADLQTKANSLVSELARQGLDIADAYFRNAQYDGENDVTVSLDDTGRGLAVIRAAGSAVLFIEFGTGVFYKSPVHPEAGQNGFARGSYGKGNGKKNTWGYYGVGGTNGQYVRTGKRGDVYKTHGNPANMSMYNTARAAEAMIAEKAKEVFG